MLCGANLIDDECRIAMREVERKIPDEMYTAVEKSPKKYFRISAISNSTTTKSDYNLFNIKQYRLLKNTSLL